MGGTRGWSWARSGLAGSVAAQWASERRKELALLRSCLDYNDRRDD
jgi:hypothetical protein